jgi:hypothetical protein
MRIEKTLDCGPYVGKHQIFVSPGQIVNAKKMCKKFKNIKNKEYNNENKKHNENNGY